MSKTRFIGMSLTVLLLLILVNITSSSDTNINIISPESRTYFDKNITLKFEVEENPIMVGYRLDKWSTKWFMVSGWEMAPAHKGHSDIDCQAGCDYYFIPGTDKKIGVILNEAEELSAKFAIIEGGVVKKYIYRDSTSNPPLTVGRDLELLDDHVVYMLSLSTYQIKLASAKREDFATLQAWNTFQFQLDDLPLGEHSLQVYLIDQEGIQKSAETSFTSADKINILSPENKIYLDKNLVLKFEVAENPIMVWYRLEDNAKKWFIIKDNQLAPAWRGFASFPCELQEVFACDFIIYENGGIKLALSPYLNNTSGELSVGGGIIDGGSLTKVVFRNSTTTPPLNIGVDLEFLDDYVIFPLNFEFYHVTSDFTGVTLEVAAAKKSDYTNLINETVFEFILNNSSYGEHNLTVSVIDKNGGETSLSTTFTIEEPDIIVLANSIDYGNAIDLLDYLRNRSIEPLRVTNDSFADFKNESFFVILGGPDAYEGVGEIVTEILSDEEEQSIRDGTRQIIVKNNIWAENQKVFVIAGKNRTQTRSSHLHNRDYIVAKFLRKAYTPVFKDEWKLCEVDSDCMIVPRNLCGCSSGGGELAINKQFKDKWYEELDKARGGRLYIACPAVMGACGYTSKCIENVCTLTSEK